MKEKVKVRPHVVEGVKHLELLESNLCTIWKEPASIPENLMKGTPHSRTQHHLTAEEYPKKGIRGHYPEPYIHYRYWCRHAVVIA